MDEAVVWSWAIMEPRILTVGTPKARIFEVEKLFA